MGFERLIVGQRGRLNTPKIRKEWDGCLQVLRKAECAQAVYKGIFKLLPTQTDLRRRWSPTL